MTQKCETQPGQAGLTGYLSLLDNRENAKILAKTQEELQRNPLAIRESRLELLSEAIGEQAGFIAIQSDLVQTARAKGGLPIIAINIRLKQMRLLGQHSARLNTLINADEWLAIYAEGDMRRRGGRPSKVVLLWDAKIAQIRCSDEAADEAISRAQHALDGCPSNSAWCTNQIGQALMVTKQERMTFACHLGCFEATKAQLADQRKAEKAARNAARAKGGVSQESKAPWKSLGTDRATFFRRKKTQANAATESERIYSGGAQAATESEPINRLVIRIIRSKTVAPEAEPLRGLSEDVRCAQGEAIAQTQSFTPIPPFDFTPRIVSVLARKQCQLRLSGAATGCL